MWAYNEEMEDQRSGVIDRKSHSKLVTNLRLECQSRARSLLPRVEEPLFLSISGFTGAVPDLRGGKGQPSSGLRALPA